MGGKKTVEKSREWEKERRDKLNVGFNNLCKLLPNHDPSISLSKMDILRKAAEYIRLLQDQNDEIKKSGGDNELRDEAERLRKRVAYLMLKTKELVEALKEAGVPIPKKKLPRKGRTAKSPSEKDQNAVPLTALPNNFQSVPCALVLTTNGSVESDTTRTPNENGKCVCSKDQKKKPLSEQNSESPPSCSSQVVSGAPLKVVCNTLTQATILNTQLQTNINTLGPGTLFLKDGRVVTVPAPASIIPQIVLKPPPAVIVIKRDKYPLIVPKRREITQTTYANKAPIPAIKTFRMESCPKVYKPKVKKKKLTKSPNNTTTPESVETTGVSNLPEGENKSPATRNPRITRKRKIGTNTVVNKKLIKDDQQVKTSENVNLGTKADLPPSKDGCPTTLSLGVQIVKPQTDNNSSKSVPVSRGSEATSQTTQTERVVNSEPNKVPTALVSPASSENVPSDVVTDCPGSSPPSTKSKSAEEPFKQIESNGQSKSSEEVDMNRQLCLSGNPSKQAPLSSGKQSVATCAFVGVASAISVENSTLENSTNLKAVPMETICMENVTLPTKPAKQLTESSPSKRSEILLPVHDQKRHSEGDSKFPNLNACESSGNFFGRNSQSLADGSGEAHQGPVTNELLLPSKPVEVSGLPSNNPRLTEKDLNSSILNSKILAVEPNKPDILSNQLNFAHKVPNECKISVSTNTKNRFDRSSVTQLSSENSSIGAKTTYDANQPIQSQFNQPLSSTITSLPSSQYSYSIPFSSVNTEISRPEIYFNYENPIANLPTATAPDTFYHNFISKPSDPVTSSLSSTSTCFTYSSFVTQTPPTRTVARQLFPPDPLCNIANNYPVINKRQDKVDGTFPPLSTPSSTQAFQFSTYSNTNSFRDPLYLPNDFVSASNKISNFSGQHSINEEKEPIRSEFTNQNFNDFLQPTSISTFPNVACSVGSIHTSGVTYDFTQTNSTNCPELPLKHTNTSENQAVQNHQKQTAYSSFNANAVPSSISLGYAPKAYSSSLGSDPPNYQKSNVNRTQKTNPSYSNSSTETYSSHTNEGLQYDFNLRNNVPTSMQNNFKPQNPQANLGASALRNDKTSAKSSNVDVLKAQASSEFSLGPHSGCSFTNNGGNREPSQYTGRSNEYNTICRGYSDAPSKAAKDKLPNFNKSSTVHLPSISQSVQTHQSYLANSNNQLTSQTAKGTPNVPTSGAHEPADRFSSSQTHFPNVAKKPNNISNQSESYVVSDPANVAQGNGVTYLGNQDAPSCNIQFQKVYKPPTNDNLVSKTNYQNEGNFPSINSFASQSNILSQHSFQNSIFSSYSCIQNSGQPTYSNSVISNSQIFPTSFNSTSTSTSGHNSVYQQNPFGFSNVTGGQIPDQVSKSTNISSSKFPSGRPSNTNVSRELRCRNPTVSSSRQQEIHMNLLPGTEQQTQTAAIPQNNINQKSCEEMANYNLGTPEEYLTQITQTNPQDVHPKQPSGPSHQSYASNLKQNLNSKLTSQCPSEAGVMTLTSTKTMDFTFSTMLTGLNEAVTNNSLAHSENLLRPHQTKNTLALPVNEKQTPGNKKGGEKPFPSNSDTNNFKALSSICSPNYLRTKDQERNSFIPIIEDVRINSEFSNDIFSSLQVPTGGAHSDSTSPTAAFLLAFPLVSTSKNTENLHDAEHQEANNTATPTTILQIGNIEPQNTELFHPLEFPKDLDTSDYLSSVHEKEKSKDPASGEKQRKQSLANLYPTSYNFPGLSTDYNSSFDPTWNDAQQKTKTPPERKKNDKANKQFNVNNFEFYNKDKKKKTKISVNWMAAPEVAENFQKEVEPNFPASSLQFPLDIDSFPELCSNKKSSNLYSWSPSKSLLPLDTSLMIPSTLPTLVGDLALGTTIPSESYTRRAEKKIQDKPPDKREQPKSQNNFLSVSQLVDPKSKKQKLTETKGKKSEKKKVQVQKKKDPNDPCMFSDNILPSLGWDKYRHKNNYSAEALIGNQEINETFNFPYQQNSSYFMNSDFSQEQPVQSQQFPNNFGFTQNQFTAFVTEDFQNDSFSVPNNPGSSKRGAPTDKRDARFKDNVTSSKFLGTPSSYPYPPPLQSFSGASVVPPSTSSVSQPPIYTTNTTTSVSNFNLSTIFPEINERTAGSQGQPTNQPLHQHGNGQHLPGNVNSFPSTSTRVYQNNSL